MDIRNDYLSVDFEDTHRYYSHLIQFLEDREPAGRFLMVFDNGHYLFSQKELSISDDERDWLKQQALENSLVSHPLPSNSRMVHALAVERLDAVMIFTLNDDNISENRVLETSKDPSVVALYLELFFAEKALCEEKRYRKYQKKQFDRKFSVLQKKYHELLEGSRQRFLVMQDQQRHYSFQLEQEIDRRTRELQGANTELKNAIEKANQMARRAQQASQVKGDFLANMSHEIRTPMNSIIGMMHVLLDTEMTREQRDYAMTVFKSAENLLQLINDILDFSKIEAGKLELDIRAFDLHTTVNDIQELLLIQAKQKGIEFHCHIEPDVPSRLQGDPGRIRQILINLVGNAIKFTEVGEVALHIALDAGHDSHVDICFSIKDTGIGIPEDKCEKLFDSFVQADSSITRRYGGSGLGLSISKLLVEKMQGNIGVESEELIGSTFWFVIPLQRPHAEDQDDINFCGVLDGRRALVLCDNETSCGLLQDHLQALGIQVEKAKNEVAAITEMKTAVKDQMPFEAVLIDMTQNKIAAEKMGQMIKADPLLSPAKLILMPSTGEKGDARKYEKAGFAAYLSKPVTRHILEDCLKAVFCPPPITSDDSLLPIITRHSIVERKRQVARILLVEDNDTNIMVASQFLARLGYSFDIARNGREALEKFGHQNYGLILMDCQMPVMSGYEATAAIRERETEAGGHLPIIAMTANAMKGDRERCLKAGMDDYIAKPIDPDQLSTILKRSITWDVSDRRESADDEKAEASDSGDSFEPDDGKIFDKEKMFERFGEDEASVDSVLTSFLNEVPMLIEQIKTSVRNRDDSDARLYSHALKGAAANVNAPLLSKAVIGLEQCIRENDFPQTMSLLPSVEEEFLKFKLEISK